MAPHLPGSRATSANSSSTVVIALFSAASPTATARSNCTVRARSTMVRATVLTGSPSTSVT
ncbi:hypothetical protein [Tomitella gaofuii]|uniref:hypothetical protein n=1 Tax=Tomitella gaofuii TaxID=2760083 RepID=UPI0015F799E9|nr:hypothetical protein [Tomitella gaofuii]